MKEEIFLTIISVSVVISIFLLFSYNFFLLLESLKKCGDLEKTYAKLCKEHKFISEREIECLKKEKEGNRTIIT